MVAIGHDGVFAEQAFADEAEALDTIRRIDDRPCLETAGAAIDGSVNSFASMQNPEDGVRIGLGSRGIT